MDRSELEPAVQETDALLRDTVVRLFRGYPPHLVEMAAREELLDLKPHLQVALAALKEAEGHRSLTDEELTHRRAFKMLVEVSKLPG